MFSPKDKIADWLESYAKVMELNYWSSTEAKSARYDEATGEWTVEVEREGKPLVLRPKQLVLATGHVAASRTCPTSPAWTSSAATSTTRPRTRARTRTRARSAWSIGSNNSAFDICGALWENGADVTMVQRSSTHIVRSDSLMEIGLGALYSEEAVAAGMTTEKADLIFASLPYRILHEFQIPAYEAMAERDKDFYDRLEKSGFEHDWGDDGSGLFMKYLRRGSGYYIDVGAADLVANGDVKLAQGPGRPPDRELGRARGRDRAAGRPGRVRHRLRLDERLGRRARSRRRPPTGSARSGASARTPPRTRARGRASSATCGSRPRSEALWIHGGNLHQSRHYSLYLALQLKARAEGIDTPVYGLQEVHHKG